MIIIEGLGRRHTSADANNGNATLLNVDETIIFRNILCMDPTIPIDYAYIVTETKMAAISLF